MSAVTITLDPTDAILATAALAREVTICRERYERAQRGWGAGPDSIEHAAWQSALRVYRAVMRATYADEMARPDLWQPGEVDGWYQDEWRPAEAAL